MISPQSPGRPRLALALAAALAACAPTSTPETAEPWPLEVGVPGVLGYVAVGLADDDLAALLETLVGAAPRGLGGGALLVVPFDPKALGGALGLVLPVRNAELFDASLRLMPGVAELDDGRWRLTLPSDALLARAMGVYEMVNMPPSALGALGAMGPGFARAAGGGGERVVPVEIDVADGWAAVVPAFEARGAAHALRRRLTALEDLARRELVAAIDAERLGLAYSHVFDLALQRLTGALQAARAMAAREGGSEFLSGLDASRLTELPGWLGFSDLVAGRLHATLPEWLAESDVTGTLATSPRDDQVMVDLRWTPGSRLDELLSATAPAPAIPQAWLVARWRSDWWGGGARAWMQPLLDLMQEPWRDVLTAMDDQLARDDGQFALMPVGETAGLFITMRPGERFDWEGLAARVREAQARARDVQDGDSVFREPGPPGDPQVVTGPDGIVRLIGRDGDVGASAGQTGDVAWLVGGEQVDVAAMVGASIGEVPTSASDSGPWLRARLPFDAGRAAVVIEMTVDGPGGRVELRLERADER